MILESSSKREDFPASQSLDLQQVDETKCINLDILKDWSPYVSCSIKINWRNNLRRAAASCHDVLFAAHWLKLNVHCSFETHMTLRYEQAAHSAQILILHHPAVSSSQSIHRTNVSILDLTFLQDLAIVCTGSQPTSLPLIRDGHTSFNGGLRQ